MTTESRRLSSVPIKRLNLIVPLPVYEEIQRLAALQTADPYDTPNVSDMARKLIWCGIIQMRSCAETGEC